jgi:hypothetical protein
VAGSARDSDPADRKCHPPQPIRPEYRQLNLISGRIDDAASLLEKARAANPRLFFVHLWLAAPLALREELDEAKSALAQSLKLKPEINSLARWRAEYPWYGNAKFVALAEPTLDAGLRRAGFPEE